MRALALFLVAGLVLSGCVGGKADDTTPPIQTTADVNADSGGIEGNVVDDEFVPIAGADVVLLGLDVKVRTDAAGAFAFSKLAPNNYSIAVTRIGYFQGSARTLVAAGEIAELDIVLKKVPVSEPSFQETMTFGGTMTASGGCQGGVDPPEGEPEGVEWLDFIIPINATKDGKELAAVFMDVDLKSIDSPGAVDVDMHLFAPEGGKEIASGTSADPNEHFDLEKYLPAGEYRLFVILCTGVNTKVEVKVMITYEQGERAAFIRNNPDEA